MFFDPRYFLYISPAIVLMLWAQWRIRSAYARGMQVPAGLSGAAAARHILDAGGLFDVAVEETHGHLSDHYDPKERVVRLSSDVYHNASATSVGIAAHEVGHALQHSQGYLPLVVRNAAVPAAQFGPMGFMILVVIGMLLQSGPLIMLGLAFYAGLVVFQLVNLPVEFDASRRAKRLLVQMNIIDDHSEGSAAVSKVLGAAGWTYVAGTLESILTLLYYVSIFTGGRSSDDDRA
ncbi:MAG: zinc metallopeptidase [Planctomycetaceae bacterium]|nr:MAG: zinc metallopeptidase [Planctomycetaceae bacterium]